MAAGGQRTHQVEYLIDPRGIGHSEPSLDCPEVVAAGPALAGLRLRDAARRTTTLAAVKACHDRLVGQRIDLDAYGLAANAEDLEDLRTTLGIVSWNLITNGSASRLAFEVARRYPIGIRSLFINSPSLPEPKSRDDRAGSSRSLDLAAGRNVRRRSGLCARLSGPRQDDSRRRSAARRDPFVVRCQRHRRSHPARTPDQVIVDGAALVRWIRSSIGAWAGSRSAEVLSTVRATGRHIERRQRRRQQSLNRCRRLPRDSDELRATQFRCPLFHRLQGPRRTDRSIPT